MAAATRYVALLRGVNVGRANRVPMAEWRELLAGLGYGDVRTLLNSGNAVFESRGRRSSEAHAARIRAAMVESLGVDVAVVVKSAAEMASIESANTLAALAPDASRLLVAFAGSAADLQGLSAVAALAVAPEQVLLGEHALYLWCAGGILESRAGAALLGRAGRNVTTRNWATVGKISALLRGEAG